MSEGGAWETGGAKSNEAILVIDDDAAILETVAAILGDEGYNVVTARNGAEGLVVAEQTMPALVLLDRWMPVLDGEGFWRELHRRGLQVPIIAMTAAHDVDSWASGLRAVGVLSKPFKLQALLDLVAAVIGAP